METALTVYKDDVAERSTFEVMPLAFQLADKLAGTEFIPVAIRNKPAAIAACILAGHEVGLPPMASLQHINVIEGRPALSAAGQRALILAKGHKIWVQEANATRATVCGQRAGETRVTEMSWTLDDAKRAQLAGKQNWQRYPKQMLIARATGDVARGTFMDVLGGIPYNVEELEDGDVIDAEVLELPTRPEEPKAPAAKRRATRAATAPAEANEPPPAPDPEPGGGEEATGSTEAEPPPAPDPEATPDDAEPAPAEQPKAGDRVEGEELTLAQRIAVACREAGIDRKQLVLAVTGKERASEVTRTQAIEVLDTAHAIGRGEASIRDDGNGNYQVVREEAGVLPDDDEGWSE
jgi:hypothetical protein